MTRFKSIITTTAKYLKLRAQDNLVESARKCRKPSPLLIKNNLKKNFFENQTEYTDKNKFSL